MILLAGPGNKVEVEQNLLNNKVKTITAYYGKELIEWGQALQETAETGLNDASYAGDAELQRSLNNDTLNEKEKLNSMIDLETPDYLLDANDTETFG